MIYSISVTNEQGETLELELAHPEKSGYAVISADGFEPPKATINKMGLGNNDGNLFNSSRIDSRTITLKLQLMEGKETVEDLRQKLYKYFLIKKQVTIVTKTDNYTLKAFGYVEKNEPDIWSKKEVVNLSIVCPDPYLYRASGNVKTSFSTVEPKFFFKFSNNSVKHPKLEMSRIEHKKYRNIKYDGDMDTGLIIVMRASGGPVKNITIFGVALKQTMKINTDKIAEIVGEGFIDKDSIEIDTRIGHKKAVLRREGKEYNVLNAITKDSDWFKITKGSNLFAYICEEGDTNLYFNIENPVCYGGI